MGSGFSVLGFSGLVDAQSLPSRFACCLFHSSGGRAGGGGELGSRASDFRVVWGLRDAGDATHKLKVQLSGLGVYAVNKAFRIECILMLQLWI